MVVEAAARQSGMSRSLDVINVCSIENGTGYRLLETITKHY